jgi:alkylation response protein AidB-like acyl-CoA dehydrogenase
MHETQAHIATHAEALRAELLPSDDEARLTDRAVELLRASGGMRLLQAKDLGGFEEHPNEFFDWVIRVGTEHPSAGWVAGVVGVHPWEISIMHPTLQEEVFGSDPDVLTASPYAPFGRAVPVDGGFRFSGRWPYSTGTDHAGWIILGGMVADGSGAAVSPPDVCHVVLPRGDWSIVEDSWDVMGLRGTGSKDVVVEDVFVPAHRVAEAARMYDGSYARERRPDSPLFQMMFGLMFPAAIAAGTFGVARHAIRAFGDAMEGRTSVAGTPARTRAIRLARLACAEADVEASIAHFRSSIAALHDHVDAGGEISLDQRHLFRRDQVRATGRCVEAIDRLFLHSGSRATGDTHPVSRAWRDLHVASTHVCNNSELTYQAWGAHRFGGPIPPGVAY